jgi:hypothetical protein
MNRANIVFGWRRKFVLKRNEPFNRRIRRMATVMALPLILSLNLVATTGGQKNADFELSGLHGTGSGELGHRIGSTGWGGALYGGWLLPGTPFSLGVRLAIVNYGSEHNVDLAGYSAAAPAGVKYNYSILFTHLVFRAQPRASLLTPYLEILAGINYFFTQAYGGGGSSVPFIIGDAVLVMNQNDSTTLLSSVAPSVGLGGGLKYRLARFGSGRKETGARVSLFLDVQGRYLIGGTAKYLRPGSIALEADRLIYDTQRSRTDFFCVSLGLSLRISS